MLELRSVTKRVGDAVHLDDVSLRLEPGTLNVLLGPTLAGKTSLMRMMARLDRPTAGTIHADGTDVTGVPVQKRNVAMVYQQFINYPSMTVFDNLASPLRLARKSRAEVRETVEQVAALMQLTPYLDRMPLQLSGGQQQRTALARALAKNAGLVLLDEPLANLDYKLREELRAELPKIFAGSGAVFVYATSEPEEALLLGGNVATLSRGRVTQFGPTVEVYRKPHDLISATTFSDPPLNVLPVHFGHEVTTAQGHPLGIAGPDRTGAGTLGVRPHHVTLAPRDGLTLTGTVGVTEITGSESYIHVRVCGEEWIVLTHGVRVMEPGTTVSLHAAAEHLLWFDDGGAAVTPLTEQMVA